MSLVRKILWLFIFCCFTSFYGISQNVDEYTLKAIWLGKFTQFINWPPDLKSTNTHFVIGLYKSDPFSGKLDSIYKNQHLKNKPVHIIIINHIDSIKKADLLLIPENHERNLEVIVKKAQQYGVLLVGDNSANAAKGLHINFIINQQRLHFEVNETAINSSGFTASFRLLNIARIIQPVNK